MNNQSKTQASQFERERESKGVSGRNAFLDTAKGLCILFVVFSHYGWSADEKLTMHFAYWVDMAVPIFMVITGYVYYLSYTRRAVKDFFDPYSAPFLAPKLLRYTSPYAIADWELEAFLLGDCVNELASDCSFGQVPYL